MRRLLARPARLTRAQILTGKTLVHLILAGLLTFQFFLGASNQLGADPVEALINFTGLNAVHLLFITLLVSPAARHLPCGDIMRYRRLLGIYTFVYALSHLLVYILFELQQDWSLLASEITERPYIIVGLCALLILTALTVTSFESLRKKMGRRWQSLHNLIYICMPLVLLHYSWSQKTIIAEPLVYWALAALVLLPRKDKIRSWFAFSKTRRR
ncbi:sulfoxide reductase heme-binding subunit YedZ [Salinimonas marina]|uniref:Protein-methionine-sulfoxide reductase heme-binding subunit MsrQ n=1 Tax=Salinimonas marina TaxID=2785918 RepID=A0A7S9HBP8_9ALTE|nr:protein-methionine-sulfoxide reductase heme-binding subunit MsrQ [Salinimonas marina]QPG04446.1 sulfoxide reductase heme-binding subunit YedZ [Salinimonas marina]